MKFMHCVALAVVCVAAWHTVTTFRRRDLEPAEIHLESGSMEPIFEDNGEFYSF